MPEFHNVEVSILVDGNALPEYQVKQDGERLMRCYVPSEVGKVSDRNL